VSLVLSLGLIEDITPFGEFDGYSNVMSQVDSGSV
jgi:hypothetical protein